MPKVGILQVLSLQGILFFRMPAKNVIRVDVENGYYHVYNRGVEKRLIFQDEQDCKVFLNYLKEYLSPVPDVTNLKKQTFTINGSVYKGFPHAPRNYNGKVELIAYCLMPNHFHLLVHQIEKGMVSNLLRSLCTRYSMYFNKKYKRVGPLLQGPYRSIAVNEENYLLHLSKYIHLNPYKYFDNLEDAFSSYGEYIGLRKTDWVKSNVILQYFDNAKLDFLKGVNTYKSFVLNNEEINKMDLGELMLD